MKLNYSIFLFFILSTSFLLSNLYGGAGQVIEQERIAKEKAEQERIAKEKAKLETRVQKEKLLDNKKKVVIQEKLGLDYVFTNPQYIKELQIEEDKLNLLKLELAALQEELRVLENNDEIPLGLLETSIEDMEANNALIVKEKKNDIKQKKTENTDEERDKVVGLKGFKEQFSKDFKKLNQKASEMSGEKTNAAFGGGLLGQFLGLNENRQKSSLVASIARSLNDLIQAQKKFGDAFGLKTKLVQNIEEKLIFEKDIGNEIPVESLETAIEDMVTNHDLIIKEIKKKEKDNEILSVEAKQTFAAGLPYYGLGTFQMIEVGYQTKTLAVRVSQLDPLLITQLGDLFFVLENVPKLITTFLSSTGTIINYATNNNIEIPKEISKVNKENEIGSFAAWN